MRFNQTQVRDLIGISVETFRHWKQVFPPFSERKKYTLDDLLAAGVLSRLTDHCGIAARHLPDISRRVVELCNTDSWTYLQGKMLIVDIAQKKCTLVKGLGSLDFQDFVVVCPLDSIMAQLQEGLSRKQPEIAQHHLRFPPIAVGRRPRA